MKNHIANIVTSCRIVGSVLLLFFPAFSVEFYVLYILCGISDMIDGTIARKTNSATEWGAKIDTAADLAFVTASLIKLLPTMPIPQWLWAWCAVIAIIKIGSILWGYATQKHFVALHTMLNKLTGLVLFLLPLTLSFIDLKYSSIVVCSIATCAAVQEGVYIANNRGNK